ncbi:hypothetical protein Tco_0881879 [Tanacetum coccineum]
MSTPAYVQLVDTDIESDPEEAPLEAKDSQLLGSRVPLMSEEFEASEPLGTRTVSSHYLVSSDSTAPLSPSHPLTHVLPTPIPTRVSFHRRTARMAMRTQPTLSPGMSAQIAEIATLSPSSFHKMYRSSYETSSSSLTVLVRKIYRGTSQLILDTDSEGGLDDEGQGLDDEGQGLDDEDQGSEDEGLGMEEEEAAPEGQQHVVLVVDTVVSEPLGLGYGVARCHAFESTEEIAPNPEDGMVYTDILTYVLLAAPVQTPLSPEWLRGSLPVSPSSPVVPSPIASLVATPTATISVDEDQFLEGFEGVVYRSGAVRDEIFSHNYRFRSLEREQDKATVTFSAIRRSRDNHDLRRQLVEERRERLELTDCVARMERRQELGGE